MEKIYVAHSKILDYKDELYEPIKKCSDKYEFILPHEKSDDIEELSKHTIKDCKILIAEVSKPETGLGIEMGWAESFDVPIISIAKTGTKISSSVKFISNIIVEYDDAEDLIDQLSGILDSFDEIMKMADEVAE